MALFALLAAFVIIPVVGLTIDGSYAYAQRRQAQNASDLASFAGANQIARGLGGPARHDCDVRQAIDRVLAANGAQAILETPDAKGSPVYGTASGPQYVSGTGAVVSAVTFDKSCATAIPTLAMGVQVGASREWTPFFLGAIGITGWTASSTSTSRAGYLSAPPAGSVFPVGLACADFPKTAFLAPWDCMNPGAVLDKTLTLCPDNQTAIECGPIQLADSTNNSPGGKGWLEFGAGNKCDGSGLGQNTTDGCSPSDNELRAELGHQGGATDPTPGTSHGCCTAVGLPGSADTVTEMTGLKGKSTTCDWYIGQTPPRVVVVPIYDTYTKTSSSRTYHIVGFAGFEVTSCDNGFAGVWRTMISGGPTNQTGSGSIKILAVQLIQ